MATGRRQSQGKSEYLVGRHIYQKKYSFSGRLYVTFIDKEGDEHKIAVSKGDNLLDVAQANYIEMEGQQQIHLPQHHSCI